MDSFCTAIHFLLLFGLSALKKEETGDYDEIDDHDWWTGLTDGPYRGPEEPPSRKIYPRVRSRPQSEIEDLMKKDGIIPDVINYAPNDTIQIVYAGGVVVDFGNELKFSQIKKEPEFVDWFLHDEYEVYTLMLLGPDSPSRQNPTNRCFKHWLVGNIPEKRIYGAELFASYTIAPRAYEQGTHRFVFIMFKQPGRYQLEYKGERIFKNIIGGRRVNFSAPSLAERYNLGTPTAINWFKVTVK